MNNREEKKILLIILACTSVLLFVGYGFGFNLNNRVYSATNKEEKIISYLEEKYNKRFKTIELIAEGYDMIRPEVNCDGTVFCPGIEDKNKYYCRYKVLSIEDELLFEVFYQETKTDYTIEEHLIESSLNNKNEYIGNIVKYTIEILNLKDFSIEKSREVENERYININEEFNDLYNETYSKKINKIAKYIKDNQNDKYPDPCIFLEYTDNIKIEISSYGVYLITLNTDYEHIEDYIKRKEIVEDATKYIADTLYLNNDDIFTNINGFGLSRVITATIKEEFYNIYDETYEKKLKKISKYVTQKNKIISQLDTSKFYKLNMLIELKYKNNVYVYIENNHISCYCNNIDYANIEEYIEAFEATCDAIGYVSYILEDKYDIIDGNKIKINKNFKKISNDNYIKKLEKIASHVYKYNKKNPNSKIEIYLEYSCGTLVKFKFKDFQIIENKGY